VDPKFRFLFIKHKVSKLLMSRFALVLCLLGFIFNFNSTASAGVSIPVAIQIVNDEISSNQFSDVIKIDQEGFLKWYEDARLTSFRKERRKEFDEAFLKNELPEGYLFHLESNLDYPSIPKRIVLTRDRGGWTVISGMVYADFTHNQLDYILDAQPNVSITENFKSDGISPMEPLPFPDSVEVRISPVSLTWNGSNGESVDAVELEFLVSRENIIDLAVYFSRFYDREGTVQRLKDALGADKEKWVNLRILLQGWISKWLNRFPFEKTAADSIGKSANDVCHGVARQFFMSELLNKGGMERSTEASEYLLRSHYEWKPSGTEPEFGDYLYLPGHHSIRFIYKDRSSKRWLGVSAWSSSHTPYRLWWVDSDYYPPYMPSSSPDPLFPESMDLWRRRN
jgi:hypothetical protein